MSHLFHSIFVIVRLGQQLRVCLRDWIARHLAHRLNYQVVRLYADWLLHGKTTLYLAYLRLLMRLQPIAWVHLDCRVPCKLNCWFSLLLFCYSCILLPYFVFIGTNSITSRTSGYNFTYLIRILLVRLLGFDIMLLNYLVALTMWSLSLFLILFLLSLLFLAIWMFFKIFTAPKF